jgi:uncharacterized protein with GYD domain
MEDIAMVTYIVLIRYLGLVNYSEKGIQMSKDISARVERTKTALVATGANITAFYMTVGQCDVVAIIEVHSADVLTQLINAIHATSGDIEILPVLNEAQVEQLLASA